jgi:hypothetical protein
MNIAKFIDKLIFADFFIPESKLDWEKASLKKPNGKRGKTMKLSQNFFFVFTV